MMTSVLLALITYITENKVSKKQLRLEVKQRNYSHWMTVECLQHDCLPCLEPSESSHQCPQTRNKHNHHDKVYTFDIMKE